MSWLFSTGLIITGFNILIISLLVVGVCLIASYGNIPFGNLPIVTITIDISGKRQPNYKDLIEQYLIDNRDFDFENEAKEAKAKWDALASSYCSQVRLWKSYKYSIYEMLRERVMSEDYSIFKWKFVRKQVRYVQKNYQRESYDTFVVSYEQKYTVAEMKEIYQELENIGFETTIQKYNIKNQRRLMTNELRQKIKERDNYTCQICGKYMPDEVGLHIDHIIAVKNGGKTVESNLQVLCDKCNLHKGASE